MLSVSFYHVLASNAKYFIFRKRSLVLKYELEDKNRSLGYFLWGYGKRN